MRQLITLCFLMLFTSHVHGHSEEDIRYLSPDGHDHGGCDSPHHACRSIAYAAGQAGKGGELRFAEGSYHVDELEDLFYLTTESAILQPGFSAEFHHQDTDSHQSLLIGVPAEYREALETLGFAVIVDDKWRGTGQGADPEMLMAVMRTAGASAGPETCTNGMASGFACSAVDLVSQVALADFSGRPSGANDVWGFVDLNSEREYALVGLRNGMAVFDIADPAAPVEIGTIPGTETGWRDIKVLQFFDAEAGRWRAYAYVSADGASDRLTVVDLSGLPNRIELVGRLTPDLRAHNLTMSGVDLTLNIALPQREAALIQAGSNLNAGGFRAFSLTDPRAPALISQAQFGYIHDGTSMVLHDPVQIAACPNRTDLCEVLADFNESTMDLWDITDPAAPTRLSSVSYPNARYVHSGSWTEDGRYVYVHDELAERDLGINTTVHIFDVADLLQPVRVGTWTGPDRAIDHNGYSRGNRYYISQYTRGLTVLDITTPTVPVRVGYFDSFPVSNSASFSGAWGVYPFLPSRHILVSDIQAGLFVLQDGTRESEHGMLEFSTPAVAATAGTVARLEVARLGGAQGDVSVGWELIFGSVDDNLMQASRGRLDWPTGDSEPRSIDIDIPAGATPQGALRRAFVRLVDPVGGATFGGDIIASVFVSEHGAPVTLDMLESPRIERSAGRAMAVIRRQGNATGAVQVDFATRAGSALEDVDYLPATGMLMWPDGDATARVIEIPVIGEAATQDRSFEVTLSNALGATVSGSSVQVTIAASLAAPPPPPPPSPSPPPPANGGGGSVDAGLLLLLALLLIHTRKRRYQLTNPCTSHIPSPHALTPGNTLRRRRTLVDVFLDGPDFVRPLRLDVAERRDDLRVAEHIAERWHVGFIVRWRERRHAVLGHRKQLPVRVMPGMARAVVRRRGQPPVLHAPTPIRLAFEFHAMAACTMHDVQLLSHVQLPGIVGIDPQRILRHRRRATTAAGSHQHSRYARGRVPDDVWRHSYPFEGISAHRR